MPDHSHPSRSETIVILGAGYSGALVATNILRKCRSDNVNIILVENCPTFGRGLAYRTWDDNFLLNVPAGNMSALADDPDHFVNYCRNIDPAFNSSSFISRRIYGDYLEHTLNQAEKEGSLPLQRLHAQAVGIAPRPEGNAFTIELNNGDYLTADKVVLALGHFPPRNPSVVNNVASSPRYLANPYDYQAIDRIGDDEAVLLLGTGHTAVDCAFRLARSSGSRKIYLVSRRGLIPQTHRPSPKAPTPIPFPAYLASTPLTIRAYIRALRQEATQRIAKNGDWRDVINELRPHTPEIWQRLPLGEKRKFLARAVPFWDIHRHRLAPTAHRRLNNMLQSGQLEIVAARNLSLQDSGSHIRATLEERKTGIIREIQAGILVNCTGPNYDITTLDHPVIRQLWASGLIQQDPLKIGLEVDERYQVINQAGQPISNLFYVGPMLKAKYWEAIAVPELRSHTMKLARILTETSDGPTP